MSYSAEGSYELYDEKRRKARKDHRCSACRETIARGQQYTRVFLVYDGSWEVLRRCQRCQAIHEHLRKVSSHVGWRIGEPLWPDERLACGREYTEHWGVEPPAEIAALAFWRPGEPTPVVDAPEGAHAADPEW